MGTTSDAIRTRSGVQLGYVCAIEGYRFLLTSGSPTAATTAWAATSWSEALSGLEVSGTIDQRLEPWSNELPIRSLTIRVLPLEDDQFAKDVFTAKPTIRRELTLGFDTGDSAGGSFDITVQDATPWNGLNFAYVNGEAFEVDSASGSLISVTADGEGFFSPFGGNNGAANRFPGAHSTAPNTNLNTYDANAPVYVTDAPATWIGKKIGLFVHRIVDGVWDVKSEASTHFAGTINAISEAPDGATIVQCEGIERALLETTLMQDQWSAKPLEGYLFKDGDYLQAGFMQRSGTIFSSLSGHVTAKDSPSGSSDEFQAGRYTAEEIGVLLADALDQDATLGVSGSGKTLRWSAQVTSANKGPRFVLTAQEGSAVDGFIQLHASDASILEFLGFNNHEVASDGNPAYRGPTNFNSSKISMEGDVAPYRYSPLARGSTVQTLELDTSDGKFFDHTSMLPPAAQEYIDTGETWSFFSLGDSVLFLARKDSATKLSEIRTNVFDGLSADTTSIKGLRLGESGTVRVRQVFFATDTFCSLVAKLFASTDGQGTNHTDHDVLPWGAGIPFDLLGSAFVQSLSALEQSGAEDSISLLIEKPTRLWDAIRSDFILRMASPIWKNGGLQIAQLNVPNASTADHTLTEHNKIDSQKTASQQTSAYLCSTLKIEYNRLPFSDKYQDSHIARDIASYEAAGGAGITKTIKSRNSYNGIDSTGSSIEALAEVITSRFLPVFARPLRIWTRSIGHNHFHIAPGDSVTVSDNWVRDPSTGARSVSNRPGTVIGVRTQFGIAGGGEYFGEVDILYTEEDRMFPLAPSMEHVATNDGSFTAGWDAAATELAVYQNRFSEAATEDDSAAFAVNDAVRVCEIDPSDPSAAASFVDTIASITKDSPGGGMDAIELTNGFGSGGRPAFDSSKRYYVNFDAYDQVGADQKLHAFLGDEGDGQILDVADPNIVADALKLTDSTADLTELPEYHAEEQYGDGEPLSTSFVRGQCRMLNNLINYKTAPHMPVHGYSNVTCSTSGASEYVVMWVFPFFLGSGRFPGGRTRKLNVAPFLRSGLGTVTCRVTSSANPPKGTDATGFTDTEWFGPKKQITFTTSSTVNFEAPTAQELEIVRGEGFPELTWITVEGNDLCQFRGLPELWLGPLQ